MQTRERGSGVGALLLRGVAGVLLAIIAAPRLVQLSDSTWWTFLPWALLALGWGVLVVRWRRSVAATGAARRDEADLGDHAS